MKILLGVTGSVAAKLTPKIQQAFMDRGHEVKTIFTQSSLYFLETDRLKIGEYEDESEWSYYKTNNQVLHIDLVKWADKFIIAPCTANTLAKIYAGICDNLLTSCVRAWDHKKKMIIAPAMNTYMYKNPPTYKQITQMTDHGIVFVDPVEKELFCGDTGVGAMAQIDDIVKAI